MGLPTTFNEASNLALEHLGGQGSRKPFSCVRTQSGEHFPSAVVVRAHRSRMFRTMAPSSHLQDGSGGLTVEDKCRCFLNGENVLALATDVQAAQNRLKLRR